MVWHVIPGMVAIDQTTGDLVQSGSGTIHAEDDPTGITALSVTDLNGVPLPSGLVPVTGGMVSPARVDFPGTPVGWWKSGDKLVHIWSPQAMESATSLSANAAQSSAEDAAGAREASEQAQSAAEAAAQSAHDAANAAGIPAGGTTGQALVKASDDDRDVEWGDAPGGGVDDAGMADLIEDSQSATRTALDGVLNAALDDKADDDAVVKLTGDQTIAGTKTFSSAPVVPDGAFTQAKISGLATALGTKATIIAAAGVTASGRIVLVDDVEDYPSQVDGGGEAGDVVVAVGTQA